MKTGKALFVLSIIMTIFSCNTDSKSNKTTINNLEVQKESLQEVNRIILTESTFGKLRLEKGMLLEELKIKEIFSDFLVSKHLGEQDGPNYYYYEIGTEAILTTPNTEREILSQLWINEKSKASDEYGVMLGMTYNEINEKRSNLSISTEHYHIFLHKEGSNIAYEMSLGNYNGPDKEAYSLDDIKNANSKIISIIWK